MRERERALLNLPCAHTYIHTYMRDSRGERERERERRLLNLSRAHTYIHERQPERERERERERESITEPFTRSYIHERQLERERESQDVGGGDGVFKGASTVQADRWWCAHSQRCQTWPWRSADLIVSQRVRYHWARLGSLGWARCEKGSVRSLASLCCWKSAVMLARLEIVLDGQGTQQQRSESPTVNLTWHASKIQGT